MQRFRRFAILVLILAAVGAVPALAQSVNVPLTNWTVPAYHRSGPAGGISTMTDVTPGVAFVGMAPCRVVDTRPSQGFGGAYGPPIMAANAIRTFDINSGPCTGIPAGVDAYSLNFAVTETAGAPGDIRAFPTGAGVSVTSVLNWNFVGNGAIANAIIIPAGTNGAIDIQVAGFDTHLVIDINGYFTDSYNSTVPFVASGLVAGGMIAGTNASNANGASGVKGVQGVVVPSTPNQGPAGVVGTSYLFDGVLGVTQCSGIGACSGGAGVKGSRTSGTSATAILSSGELGVASLGGRFFNDVEINGDLEIGTADTTFGDGDLTTNGVKMFIEPHPTDAKKAIRYVSLEGPESGTYFRGRARFQNGTARIVVPDDFRFVTASEGLTVQITPIGGMATVGVLKLGLDEIIVQGSRNLEFSYLVQGVRRTYADFQPIGDAGVHYASGPRARLGENMRAETRRRLIANGTYNPDGTVNMETARRLGWERLWSARERGEAPPAQPNP